MTAYRLDVHRAEQSNPVRVEYFTADDHDRAVAAAAVVLAVVTADPTLHFGALWGHLEPASSQGDYIADVEFTLHVHGSWGEDGQCAGCGADRDEVPADDGWVDLSELLLIDQEWS